MSWVAAPGDPVETDDVIRAAAGSTISQDFNVWIAARFHRRVAAAFARLPCPYRVPKSELWRDG